MIPSMPKLCTVKELAEYLGVSHHEGYAAIKDIPETCVIRLGGRIRVNLDALKQWIDSGGKVPA